MSDLLQWVNRLAVVYAIHAEGRGCSVICPALVLIMCDSDDILEL